jgi:hypothetical protein
MLEEETVKYMRRYESSRKYIIECEVHCSVERAKQKLKEIRNEK